MNDQRKVILFIAMSIDGFIAKSDGDISFLSVVEKEGEDYGYSKFLESVDTVVLGRKTYEKVLSMGIEQPYGDRKVIVLTRNPHPETDQITYFSGNLQDLILTLKRQKGKHIYCDGGAETIHQLLLDDLIDEMIISVIPVLLGNGIRLFGQSSPERKLHLIKSTSFEKGLVQLHYSRS
jgi:dihydrofolate reductase